MPAAEGRYDGSAGVGRREWRSCIKMLFNVEGGSLDADETGTRQPWGFIF